MATRKRGRGGRDDSAVAGVIVPSQPDNATSLALRVPRRKPGRQSAAQKEQYEEEVEAFCEALLDFQSESALGFDPSSRGWCYILEEYGLRKGDFDTAQRLINDCRKGGLLPLDFCGEDSKREFVNLEYLDDDDPEGEARDIIDSVRDRPDLYTPFSFWDDQDYYLQMLVEKGDIRSLFAPICAEFHVPIANAGGWADINSRAQLMWRCARWEDEGKRCVLLYFGDFDPGGLNISNTLPENLEELAVAVDWSPDDLIVDRFGLDFDFIQAENLTWVDNLITGSGKDLASPKHKDHDKPYVQDYLDAYCYRNPDGSWHGRKVESNALLAPRVVARGRQLCRGAILKYVDEDAPDEYEERLEPEREKVREETVRLLREEFGR